MRRIMTSVGFFSFFFFRFIRSFFGLCLQLSSQIQCQRLRHPDAAEVPSESQEPGHGRLPAQPATLLLGMAQLSPVSVMSRLMN